VLASLRAVEALKPVLARVVLARAWLPGALRAAEGPNGWGENRGRSETQGNVLASTGRRSSTSSSLSVQTLAPGSAPSFFEGAHAARHAVGGESNLLGEGSVSARMYGGVSRCLRH